MKLLTKVLPDDHNLFLFGDQHKGSVLSVKRGWNMMLDLMLSEYDGCKNNYGADGGDAIEAIMIDDRRYSPEKRREPLPLMQAKDAVKDREPIKDILLWMLMGNHERTLWKFGDLTEWIADELGTDYGTYSTKVSIKDTKGKLMYKLYDTHGSKTINSTADDPVRRETNMKLVLKRHLKRMFGDCAVMIKHHAHKLLVNKPTSELYLVDNGKKIQQGYTHWGQTEHFIHPDYRWYGCAGSFLKLYGDNMSGYAEIAEYDPTELGFLILKVRDKKIVDLEPYYLRI